MSARTPIPLRPDPSAIREDAMRSLIKAAIIAAKCAIDRSTWASGEGDRITELVLRAAVPPLSTADAGALLTVATAFVDALRPMSAAAQLISRSLQLAWNAANVVSVPNMTLPLANFVGQGQPIPAVIGHTTAALLEPYKLAVITSLTSEMLRNPAVEGIIRQILIENCGPSLDAAMFSTAAAVADVRPSGLLCNLTALASSTPGANKTDDCIADLKALIHAVAPVAGGGSIVFVASADTAFSISARIEDNPYDVLPSSALPAGEVIAVATPSLATIVDAPLIDGSTVAVAHQDDAPEPISSPGSPPTVAAPTRSYYQTDSVALRLRLPATWALRDPRGIAFMQGCEW